MQTMLNDLVQHKWFSKSADSLLLKLPPHTSADFDTVVVIETAGR
jgi:hypothetical protein